MKRGRRVDKESTYGSQSKVTRFYKKGVHHKASLNPGTLDMFRRRQPGEELPTGKKALLAGVPKLYNEKEASKLFASALQRSVARVVAKQKPQPIKRRPNTGSYGCEMKPPQIELEDTVESSLDMDQKKAIDYVRQGKSFVLLGEAGTGKTFLLSTLIKGLRAAGTVVAPCATTGVAAAAIQGMTVYAYAGMGLFRDKSLQVLTARVQKNKTLRNKWKDLQVLILDEFTMLSREDFVKLESVVRVARQGVRSTTPFGGLCVILCGDPCQLQSVDAAPNEIPLYLSDPLSRAIPHLLCLKQRHRTRSKAYAMALADIRKGHISSRVCAVLEPRVGVPVPQDVQAVHICAHRADVAKYNKEGLDSLTGPVYTRLARPGLIWKHKGKVVAEIQKGSAMETIVHEIATLSPKEARRVLESRVTKQMSIADLSATRISGSSKASDTSPFHVSEFTFVDQVNMDSFNDTNVQLSGTIERMFQEGHMKPRLLLKKGAPVMLIKNISSMMQHGLCNGASGQVVGFTYTPEVLKSMGGRRVCPQRTQDADQIIDPPEGTTGSHMNGTQTTLTDHMDKTFAVSSLYTHPSDARSLCEPFDTECTEPITPDRFPVVEFTNVGRFVCAPVKEERVVTTCPGYGEASVFVEQIPLMLCRALTVHKVQGMTLNAAVIHLDWKMSQFNQAYVALSRVRTEKGLFLPTFHPKAIRSDEHTCLFMQYIEEAVCDPSAPLLLRDIQRQVLDKTTHEEA